MGSSPVSSRRGIQIAGFSLTSHDARSSLISVGKSHSNIIEGIASPVHTRGNRFQPESEETGRTQSTTVARPHVAKTATRRGGRSTCQPQFDVVIVETTILAEHHRPFSRVISRFADEIDKGHICFRVLVPREDHCGYEAPGTVPKNRHADRVAVEEGGITQGGRSLRFLALNLSVAVLLASIDASALTARVDPDELNLLATPAPTYMALHTIPLNDFVPP